MQIMGLSEGLLLDIQPFFKKVRDSAIVAFSSGM
jgi:hypothetical protein